MTGTFVSFKDANGLVWWADETGIMKGWTFYYKSADCSGQAYAYAVLTNMAFTDGVPVRRSPRSPLRFQLRPDARLCQQRSGSCCPLSPLGRRAPMLCRRTRFSEQRSMMLIVEHSSRTREDAYESR
jgi:hypothetical protein